MKNKIQKLENKHIQMIALGGAVGAAFFLNSPLASGMSGPSVILAYLLGGLMIYVIMRSLGEITVNGNLTGTYIDYTKYYISDFAGYLLGWNNWLIFTLICVLELHTIGLLLTIWISCPHWLIYVGFTCIFCGFNLLGVRWFGETQFWFVCLKLSIIMIIFVVTGWVVSHHPFFINHALIRLEKYPYIATAFSHGINGFAKSIFLVCLSFCGIELASIAAPDAKDPQVSVPRAVNGVLFKILFFYIGTMLVFTLMSSHYIQAQGHFALIRESVKPGVSLVHQVIQSIATIAALSSFNSFLYGSSRVLYRMSCNQHAPRLLSMVNRAGVPIYSIILTSILIVVLTWLIDNYAHKLFWKISKIATVSGIVINWFTIIIVHFIYRFRNQNNPKNIEFRVPLYPYLNILIAMFLIFILIALFIANGFQFALITIPLWYFLLLICYNIARSG